MVAERSDRAILSRLFQKLSRLAPMLNTPEAKGISETPNGSRLYLDIHARHPAHTVIFLAQYYTSSSGDWLPAPEFEIAVYLSRQEAEALACHEPDGSQRVGGATSEEFHTCLDRWLDQWLELGHLIKSDSDADA